MVISGWMNVSLIQCLGKQQHLDPVQTADVWSEGKVAHVSVQCVDLVLTKNSLMDKEHFFRPVCVDRTQRSSVKQHHFVRPVCGPVPGSCDS